MNELTEAQKERLIMLAEEAGEVIQAVGKILRHGYNSCHLDNDDISNRLDLVRELDDLNAIIGEMVKKGDIMYGYNKELFNAVWKRKLKYTHYQDNS
jgi:hypothetical protein